MEKNIVDNKVETLNTVVLDRSVAILGLGNMGIALVKGLGNSGEFSDYTFNISNGEYDRTVEKTSAVSLGENILISENNIEAVRSSRIVFLALKQVAMKREIEVLCESDLLDDKVLVSLAAGVRMDTLKKWAGNNRQPVARIMPNTAASVGKGVMGWAVSNEVEYGDIKLIRDICASLGSEEHVESDDGIDKITAISGSGIAYFFEMGNQLQQAAMALGFKDKDAVRIAKQTLLGAAMKAVNDEDDFTTLRTKVTSPKGTTEKALEVFGKYEFGLLMHDAVMAAKMRAGEIGEEFEAL